MADEYIRREDAITAACKGFCHPGVSCPDEPCREQTKYLRGLPPADVVKVVRCKDCKFYTSMRPDIKTGICDLNVHHMGDDGFCSCGERREE